MRCPFWQTRSVVRSHIAGEATTPTLLQLGSSGMVRADDAGKTCLCRTTPHILAEPKRLASRAKQSESCSTVSFAEKGINDRGRTPYEMRKRNLKSRVQMPFSSFLTGVTGQMSDAPVRHTEAANRAMAAGLGRVGGRDAPLAVLSDAPGGEWLGSVAPLGLGLESRGRT